MKKLMSSYSPKYPTILVYMLQGTEYQTDPYLRWYWRAENFGSVMKRRSLHKTKAAKLLLLALTAGMLLQVMVGAVFLGFGLKGDDVALSVIGAALIILYPITWAHLAIVPLWLGRVLVVRPKERQLIRRSEGIFAKHPGTRIGVAGSYGKTTMKELLGTVLSEGKNVAITPANMNVASSHAKFAARLKGDEDILVIEYGEGRPGDVGRFAATTQPNIGVITGIAPAHLDQYPTLDAAARDIFSLADYLEDKHVYVNAESEAALPYIKEGHVTYTSKGVDEWTVQKIDVNFDGVKFEMHKGSEKLKLHSGLLGRHQVGPLAAVVALADALGLSNAEIQAGVAKTQSFEHRMQARSLHGAWIIDDTYNGNIDGIKAGLALLVDLPGKRKIYVTPGLVDQGVETERVHKHMGELIAAAKPDRVVLMQNSATEHIQTGLTEHGYAGEVQIEDNPLDFYTNIQHFVANGDVVMMQNDWTDNYA